MSRGLLILCLLAAPMLRLAESAEDLTASLSEQGGPGAIDPIDPNDRDGVPAFATAPRLVLHQLAPALTPLDLDGPAAWPRSIGPGPSPTVAPPSVPPPTRGRRLSRLRVLLI